jgi:phosphoserine phosphatase
METKPNPRGKRPRLSLKAPGWTAAARVALEKLLRAGSGKGWPVVFDFDNTIVSGDIGEAVLAQLVKTGRLRTENIPATLAPAFRHPDGGQVTLQKCVDVTEYYEKLLAPTHHGLEDKAPLANGYAWAVEVLEGLTPWEIVEATRSAFAASAPGKRNLIEATPGITAYPAPFFHPEMVELIAQILRHGFDFWVVSASNAWSVRWMVLEALNPLLREQGVPRGVRVDHIVGVSTLIADRAGQLFKDPVLVKENAAYAALDPKVLKRFRLTSRLHFPVPSYSGKVACIFDLIGGAPYLCAGDSPGDLPMLRYSKHRLWLARREKPAYQEALATLPQSVLRSGWIMQPTQAGEHPGFLPG